MELSTITGVRYCHYTSVENARRILSAERLYLSKMDNMNDISEAELHKNDEYMTFSTCFCHSESKNIPMFYLYSGIDGKGCRIEMSAAKIKSIIRNVEIYPVNSKNICLKKPLNSEDYIIDYDWVHYISNNGFGSYRGKEGKWYTSFEDACKNEDVYFFLKNYIWRYEKEFRIIVRVKKDFPYKRIALRVPVKEKENSISITCGPELGKSEVDGIREEFNTYGIQKINSFSDDHIKISMNLVKRNL